MEKQAKTDSAVGRGSEILCDLINETGAQDFPYASSGSRARALLRGWMIMLRRPCRRLCQEMQQTTRGPSFENLYFGDAVAGLTLKQFRDFRRR